MTVPGPGCTPVSDLLDQAIGYALASADLVTPDLLARSTPCSAWNLGMLLAHFGESLAALTEGFADGTVCLTRACEPGPADVGPAGLRARCDRLRAAAARPAARPAAPSSAPPSPAPRRPAAARPAAPRPGATADRPVAIGEHTVPYAVLGWTAAIEIAVHGWDIAAACGTPRPLPAELAVPLLAAAPALIPDSVRPGLFAPPLPPRTCAAPGDRLLAFLGRS